MRLLRHHPGRRHPLARAICVVAVCATALAGLSLTSATPAHAASGDLVITYKADGIDPSVLNNFINVTWPRLVGTGTIAQQIANSYAMIPSGMPDPAPSFPELDSATLTVTSSGTGSAATNTITLDIPATAVHTNIPGWIASIIATGIGVLAGLAAAAACEIYLSPAASPVCGMVFGFVIGFAGTLVGTVLSGGTLTDWQPWVQAIFVGLLSGAPAALSKWVLPWLVRSYPQWLATAKTVIGNAVTSLASWVGDWVTGAWNWASNFLDLMRTGIPAVLRGLMSNPNSLAGLRRWENFQHPGSMEMMAFGDSITYGYGSSTTSGYRCDLETDLSQLSVGYQFVGSLSSGACSQPNNEGHSGWTIDQLAAIEHSTITSYEPNVVLLDAGTNDINGNYNRATAPARLQNLVRSILNDDRGVTILVASLIPTPFPDVASAMNTFNQDASALIGQMQASGDKVEWVDMSAVQTYDLYDTLHPNDAGYEKMDLAWMSGITDAVNNSWITPPNQPPPLSPPPPTGGPVKGWLPQGVIATGTMTQGSYPGSLNLSGDPVQFATLDYGSKPAYVVNHGDGTLDVWTNGGTGSNGAINWIGHGTVGALNYVHNGVWRLVPLMGSRDDLVEIYSNKVIDYVNLGTPGDGNLNWTYFQDITPPGWADPPGQIQFADLTGDGRADFLDVAPNGSVTAWLNGGQDPQGHLVWFPLGVIATGVGDPGSQIQFADLNGDGKADYIDVAPNSSVQAWLNGGPNPAGGYYWFPQGVIASGVGDPGSQIQFADLNGDGKADYLDVNPATGETREWQNGGPGTGGDWYWWPQGTIADGNRSRVVYADIDGDHKADYLQVNADSSVQAWTNGGPNPNGGYYWFPQGTIATGVGAPGSEVQFADITGDGKADFLVVNPDSSVQAWANGGPNPNGGYYWFPLGTVATGVGAPGSQIQFADLNGDGKADYIDVAPNGSVQAWLNGGPNPAGGYYWFPQGVIASGVGAPGYQIRFAPFYGDGKADYLVLGDNGAVQVWYNGGPNPAGGDWYWFPGGQTASGVGDPGSQIQFADINGDGRADYLDVNPATGSTQMWLNFG